MPEIGQPAPPFSLPADDGTTVSLAGLHGRPVVLYFYPRDDTPGCTIEACDFRDHNQAWADDLDAVVLGVSADGAAAHQRFRKKYGLNFVLLTDADKEVMRSYGAFGAKVMYGKQIMGIIRSTFLIDAQGVLVKAWPKVAVKGHAEAVQAALQQLKR